ncbi:MAG TPA: fructose-1,6-bisphosphate aldolase, class II [Firmicutes bacterium]|jgi:tagatose 1,6-diphosphate aldolase GatY/KbaY|nr:fructose-1,6-bisphosphate aldolase, class II [Bacillota bacterium]
MPLVTSKQMMVDAQNGKYAVAAFNIENMEMVQTVLETAAELQAPVMIQTTPGTVKYAGVAMLAAMVQTAAKTCPVPVALHLDHGESYELAVQALHSGYTSIMIDGSKLPFKENIALSKRVVDMAHAVGIPVEAELGKVGGKEDSLEVSDKSAAFTDPGEAKEFVLQTGIDSLAVAIGTAHGFYKGEPKLDFDRLAKIRDVVEILLVLHGASGVPDDMVRKAVALGISKVNFATELRAALTRGVREALVDQSIIDPKKFMASGKKAVKEIVKQKIIICGCDHKANSYR